MLKQSQALPVALEQRGYRAQRAQGHDHQHQLQHGEGSVGHGEAGTGVDMIEYVAGGTGRVGTVRTHAGAEVGVPVPLLGQAGVPLQRIAAAAPALRR